jgi:hypothetical protein
MDEKEVEKINSTHSTYTIQQSQSAVILFNFLHKLKIKKYKKEFITYIKNKNKLINIL